MSCSIRFARREDTPTILHFIRALAEYEKLSDAVVATEDQVRQTLFGDSPAAEVVLAYWNDQPVGFALFFHNYSTFLAKKGLYLEDLFVLPDFRGKGIGKALLSTLAKIAVDRDCGRFEWAVLDWNEPAMKFYASLGAAPVKEWVIHRVTGDALRRLAETAPKNH